MRWTYGVSFLNNLHLAFVHVFDHVIVDLELHVQGFLGVGEAGAQEALDVLILGYLTDEFGVLQELVDATVGDLLRSRFDNLGDSSKGRLELLDALVGSLGSGGLVNLVTAATAGHGFCRRRLGDFALSTVDAASAPSATSGRADVGSGGFLGHIVVDLGEIGGLVVQVAHGGGGVVLRCVVVGV